MMLAVLAFIWGTHFGGPTLSDNVIVNATTTDASSNVVIIGQFTSAAGGVSFGGANLVSAGVEDIFIAKYTSSGAHSWSISFGSTGSDIGFGIGTDSSGNIYVVGQFQNTVNFGGSALVSAGGADIFVAKYSSAGAHVWSKRFGGTGNDVGNAIDVLADGTLVIVGDFGNFGTAVDFGGGALASAGGPDIFVAKYDSSGDYIWANRIGGTSQDKGLGVAMSATGDVAVTGYFSSSILMPCMSLASAGLTDGIIVEYSTTGSLVWVRRFGGTSDDRGTAIAIGQSNEVVVTGYFNNTANFGGGIHPSTGGGTDIFLANYSSAGIWMWDKVFGTSAGFGDASKAVAVDAAGNIALTGAMLNGLDFGGGTLCPTCSTYDVFIAKFDSSGIHQWSDRYETVTQDEHGNGITFDASGNIIVAGDYFDVIDFGGGNMTSPGGTDGFLVKFGP
jgi:hypothetical protein